MKKAKATTKPKEAWAFWANMYGPWYSKPVKVRYNDELGSWWDPSGDGDIEKMGLDTPTLGFVRFADPDKAQVERFIQGFMEARRLMGTFTGTGSLASKE